MRGKEERHSKVIYSDVFSLSQTHTYLSSKTVLGSSAPELREYDTIKFVGYRGFFTVFVFISRHVGTGFGFGATLTN